MESKSYYNLERMRLGNLMAGFCYISCITLACFSYGYNEPIKEKVRSYNSNESFNIVYRDKDIEKPKEEILSKPIVSTQKDPEINLNDSLVFSDNKDGVVTDNKGDVDLGLPIGDSTHIVTDNKVVDVVVDVVEDYPDIEAEFIGGDKAWTNYLITELKYPDYSLELGEQGVVYLSFVVDMDGTVSDVRILKSVSVYIDREAKRVIQSSPKWKPGSVGGKSVKTRMNIPLHFKIN